MERRQPQIPPDTFLRGVRVLVADDDDETREWLRAVLGGAGALVSEADSGVALLQGLTRESFELVVTDVRMSWASGAQILAMARTAGFRMPFLVVTAYSSEGLRRELRQPGARLLEKPLDVGRVLEAVRELLDEFEREREGDAAGER